MNETKTIIGKIIHINGKGFGFITSDSIEFTRIYFHWTGLSKDTIHFKELEKGMKVEFIPIKLPEKGWRAIKINILNAERNIV